MARHNPHQDMSTADDHTQMVLDGTKIAWHPDRVEAWERGERIAPITIDMALTRACNYACGFCYAMLQENDRSVITEDTMRRFIDDCERMGVRAISLVSDGESTLSKAFIKTIQWGDAAGISMAVGTNGWLLGEEVLEQILPHLTYLRFNFSGGEPKRYAEIMGVKEEDFYRVSNNAATAAKIKRRDNLGVTIGLQMVLMPQDIDQVLPLAHHGKTLGVDYTIIKHCSDDEDGNLGVDYQAYSALYPLLAEAEKISTDDYDVVIKWSKIGDAGTRSYKRCYGPPFMIQISGSGLVAPCGMLFNDKYAKFHIGNIVEQSWYDIWQSERYWEVMSYLGSDDFNAQTMCGSLCLQHKVNEALDGHMNHDRRIGAPAGKQPMHINFV